MNTSSAFGALVGAGRKKKPAVKKPAAMKPKMPRKPKGRRGM